MVPRDEVCDQDSAALSQTFQSERTTQQELYYSQRQEVPEGRKELFTFLLNQGERRLGIQKRTLKR